MVFEIENVTSEKMMLIGIIGVLEVLKKNGINIDESEKILFSPHMIKKLQGYGCSAKILKILEKGCELEDIASLMPEKLYEVINELQQDSLNLLKEYKVYDKSFWIK